MPSLADPASAREAATVAAKALAACLRVLHGLRLLLLGLHLVKVVQVLLLENIIDLLHMPHVSERLPLARGQRGIFPWLENTSRDKRSEEEGSSMSDMKRFTFGYGSV